MNDQKLDKKKIIKICTQHDVVKIGVFGSYSKGENNSASDIDLLVTFSQKKGLLSLIKLERELTEKLGVKIDLLTESAISPYLKNKILNEVKIIYEA